MDTGIDQNMAQINSFRSALKTAKHPVALAGAGLSAASGIPTFRGAGGLWRQHDSISLATPEAFRIDPSKVWQFYHYRRENCLKAKPNQAHSTLAYLSTDEGRKNVFSTAKSFDLITQNVDGLSIRAIATEKPKAKEPIQMHGSIFRTRCTKCQEERNNFDSPIAPGLSGSEVLEKEYRNIPLDQLPHCQKVGCNGLLRPAVAWFGEGIPALDEIDHILSKCDLLLVLGTSATVYPAAGFASRVRTNGGKTAIFNIERPDNFNGDQASDWYFEGGVEDILPWAIGLQQSKLY